MNSSVNLSYLSESNPFLCHLGKINYINCFLNLFAIFHLNVHQAKWTGITVKKFTNDNFLKEGSQFYRLICSVLEARAINISSIFIMFHDSFLN